MGMYDTVLIKCPKCDGDIEFQSKAGKCLLSTYTLRDAPEELIDDIIDEGSVWCCNCEVDLKVFEKIVKKIILYIDNNE